jgi:hypothetical protein
LSGRHIDGRKWLSQGNHRQGHYREGFPHLGRNGSGGDGLSELESFDSAAQAKRNLRSAIEKVSARLGNTPTICRKCYVHPEVLNSYMDGNLLLEIKSHAESELRSAVGSLKPEEAAVLALLRGRLAKEAQQSVSASSNFPSLTNYVTGFVLGEGKWDRIYGVRATT